MSGPIFQHPLLKDLDYYWRLEPETKHLCTFKSHWRQEKGKQPEWIERDPFRYMRGEHSDVRVYISFADKHFLSRQPEEVYISHDNVRISLNSHDFDGLRE
jgi:hypothetical protein